MKKLVFAFSVLLFVTACGNKATNKVDGTDAQAVASGTGDTLMVDLQQSSINWEGSKPAGKHHGTIGIKQAALVVKADSLVSGWFVIDMNAIVDKDLTDAATNEKLVGHLKSADFFDVAKYPESKFDITKVEAVAGDAGNYTISGNLKMKDVDKNITFTAKITKEGDTYKAVSAPFTIDRTQWNVKYGSKSIVGNIKDKLIDDNIQLQITIVAKAK